MAICKWCGRRVAGDDAIQRKEWCAGMRRLLVIGAVLPEEHHVRCFMVALMSRGKAPPSIPKRSVVNERWNMQLAAALVDVHRRLWGFNDSAEDHRLPWAMARQVVMKRLGRLICREVQRDQRQSVRQVQLSVSA